MLVPNSDGKPWILLNETNDVETLGMLRWREDTHLGHCLHGRPRIGSRIRFLLSMLHAQVRVTTASDLALDAQPHCTPLCIDPCA